MKKRYSLLGMTAVVALSLALPAIAAQHSRPHRMTHHRHQAVRRAEQGSVHRVKGIVESHPTETFDWLGTPSPTLTQADAQKLARTGTVDLPVFITRAGTVSVRGDVPVGSTSKKAEGAGAEGPEIDGWVPLASEAGIEPASANASGPGEIDVPLHLTRTVQARLAEGEELALDLVVGFDGGAEHLATVVNLAAGG